MSTLKVNSIQNAAGVEVYTAKAWVNFNGSGTVAIRAAGNVSSITDNGAGDYTVNFAVAMADANYAPVFSCQNLNEDAANESVSIRNGFNPTASSVRLAVARPAWEYIDPIYVNVVVFR